MNDRKTEKIIVYIQLTLGVTLLAISIYTFREYLSSITKLYGKDNISYLKVFLNFSSFFIVSTLAICSAILSLKNNFYGWLLSVSSWLSIAISSFFALHRTLLSENELDRKMLISVFSSILIVSSIFTIILAVRLKNKYDLKIQHYLLFGIVAFVLSIDKIFLA